MELATREMGSGDPVVILHGLFGSSDNWQGIAKSLADRYRVLIMDLPDHGSSPHTSGFSFAEYADSVAETLDGLGIAAARVLGHSMGGKVAMQLALTAPERVAALIVADIAPKRYPDYHRAIIDGMKRVSEVGAATRPEADEALAEYVNEKPVRSFLLKNFVRWEDGSYGWRINLSILDRDYDAVAGWPGTAGRFEGPALFLSGGRSDYVSANDESVIREQFPNALFEVLPDAGHWLHAEQPQNFVEQVTRFLDSARAEGTIQ